VEIHRRLFSFAFSFAGGLGMLAVSLDFLGEYVEWAGQLATRYSGPPPWVIELWIICAIYAIAGGLLLLGFPRWSFAWGSLVVVPAFTYTLLIAFWYADLMFDIAFLFFLRSGFPGLFALVGGLIPIVRRALRSESGPSRGHPPPVARTL